MNRTQRFLINSFSLYVKLAIMLIILVSVVAAVLVSVDVRGISAFNDLFQILP